MKDKSIAPIFLTVSLAFMLVVIMAIVRGGGAKPQIGEGTNVSIVNGKQIIEVIARRGYSPRNTIAKAGIPTVIKVRTEGTFDCSSSVVIPALNFSKFLGSTDEVEIPLPEQKNGDTVTGLCGMGMYNFKVEFRE